MSAAPGTLNAPADLLSTGLPMELELELLVGGGVVLFGVLMGLGRVVAVIPMRRKQRILVERIRPLVGLLLILPYLFFALRVAVEHGGRAQLLVLAVLCLGMLVGGWFLIRDLLAGVVVKTGRLCSEGDQVRIGDYQGRVAQMGLRGVRLETSQGEEAVIPYSVLARSTLMRSPSEEGVALHVFQLRTPPNVSVSDTRQAVIEGAMCSHWASIVREPQITPLGNHLYEITVFALAADYGPEVEAAVIESTGFLRGRVSAAPDTRAG